MTRSPDHPIRSDLLRPFLPAPLSEPQLSALATYLDLLLRWNARFNLTAVRDPEHIVTRHIGESLFAAAQLFGERDTGNGKRVFDLGSGAGFPGIPLKLYAPSIHLTLIESQHKKATFLREVIRTLHLTDVDVFAGRAEDILVSTAPLREPPTTGSLDHPSTRCAADVVTLRAVERFDRALPLAASLLRSSASSAVESPCVCLLIGSAQVARAHQLLPHFRWREPVPIPLSSARVILIGEAS